MKTKKSERANLDSKRATFILMGLCVSLAIVFYAFETKSKINSYSDFKQGINIPTDEAIIPTQREEKKPEMSAAPKFFGGNIRLVDFVLPSDTFDFVTEYGSEGPDIPIIEKPIEEDPNDPIILTPQFNAEFPGGEAAMFKYLAENVKYPQLDLEIGNEGIVYVQFVVRKDGNIDNVKVLRGVSETLDIEAKRVIVGMPNWIPARMGTRKVNCYYQIPISFKLK